MKKSIIFTVLITIALQSLAGWEITYRISDDEGTVSYDVMLIENHVVKYSGMDASFIYDTKNHQFSFLLAENNSFWTGNIKDFRTELGSAVKAILDEMIQGLPQNEQEMFSEMLGEMNQMYDSPAPEVISSIPIEILNTGTKENIAGYASVKYEVLVDGESVETLWLSSGLDVSDDLDSKKIAEMFNEITPTIEDEIYYEFTNEYLDLWDKGFRMKSIDDEGESIEVIKVTEREISQDELKIPEGYTRISPAELMRQQMLGDPETENDGQW